MASITLNEQQIMKCSLCHNYLSVPPIFISSMNGTQRCGRCFEFASLSATRNVAYEKIAEQANFPCINKDCEEKIPWADVLHHEMNCLHTIIKCPIYPHGCDELIKISELENHYIKRHRRYLFYRKISHKLDINRNKTFLLVKYNTPFFVYIISCMRTKKMCIAVLALSSNIHEKYHFNIQLTSDLKPNYEIAIKNQEIIPFNEREHCLRCIQGVCNIAFHKYSLKNNFGNWYDIFENIPAKMNWSGLEGILGGAISFTITLETKDEENNRDNPPLQSHNTIQSPNLIFQHLLECHICMEYMRPPIFLCETGHTMCRNCKPKLEQCPSCKLRITETRNYSLESIIENVELPCMYQERGCEFVSIIPEVYEHELYCLYGNTLRNKDENNSNNSPLQFKKRNLAISTSDNVFRHLLECQVCLEYMKPPIFLCKTGHAMCSNCKLRLEQCPSCKLSIGETRNYSLESIVENVKLPCVHRELGCDFLDIIPEVYEHEFNCRYG